MSVVDGLAVVDPEKCVGCGACVEQCPRGVIALIPRKAKTAVACNSPLKGPDVRKLCSVGCIGCGICAKNCPSQAIEMKGALAWIDPSKCTNCGLCATKCPVKVITDRQQETKKVLA
jgi:electron transport complex protein RnfB